MICGFSLRNNLLFCHTSCWLLNSRAHVALREIVEAALIVPWRAAALWSFPVCGCPLHPICRIYYFTVYFGQKKDIHAYVTWSLLQNMAQAQLWKPWYFKTSDVGYFFFDWPKRNRPLLMKKWKCMWGVCMLFSPLHHDQMYRLLLSSLENLLFKLLPVFQL